MITHRITHGLLYKSPWPGQGLPIELWFEQCAANLEVWVRIRDMPVFVGCVYLYGVFSWECVLGVTCDAAKQRNSILSLK